MEAKDKRIKLVNEIFSGIKVHYLLKLIQNVALQFRNIIADVLYVVIGRSSNIAVK